MAPENTMMSFRKSMECDVVAFETDVQLRYQTVPQTLASNLWIYSCVCIMYVCVCLILLSLFFQ